MKFLVAAVSTLALAASPALAQGNGKNNGNSRGDQHSQSERGNGGNGNAERGNRGNGANRQAENQDGNVQRGNGNAQRQSADREARENVQTQRHNGSDRRDIDDSARSNRTGDNGNRNANRNRVHDRGDGVNFRIETRRDRGLIDRVLYRETGLADGCPPGLAKKRNGCTPPGQLRQQSDRYRRYSTYAPNWWGLPYDRGDYFYDDGYLMRYGNDGIAGYIPLLGGALSIGNAWPDNYGYSRMPSYYSSYYGLGDNYRYADNVVYRVDPDTAAIASVAALLTGEEFAIGQPVPSGYDVYNVPYSYRDDYRDGPDAYYRYNDGYVYQVDPETRLVAAAIELLL